MKLKAKEISLTRAAANRRVFALYKSAKGDPMPELTPEETRAEVRKAVEGVDPAICSELDEIIAKAAEKDDRSLSPRAAGVIKAIGRLLAPHAGEILSSDIMAACKAAGLDSKGAADALGKAAKDAKAIDDEEDEAEDAEVADEVADDVEADEDLEEDEEASADDDEEEEDEDDLPAKKAANVAPASELQQDRSVAPVADDAEAATQQPKGNSVAKAAIAPVVKAAEYEEMRKHNRQLSEQVEELRKHVQEQEALRKSEADARDLAELKKSVKETYGHLALDADVVAPALKSLRDMEDQTHYNAMVEVLTKSAEYSKRMEGPSGLFKSFGVSGSAAVTSNSEDELTTLAKSEMAKPEHSGKSFQQVYRDVAKSSAGRSLKQRIRREAQGEI